MFFFFFQAEDGIRDYKVTGVQTCALPILLQEGSTALKYFREASRLTAEPPDAAALNFRIGSNLAAGEHWEAAATYLRKAVRRSEERRVGKECRSRWRA